MAQDETALKLLSERILGCAFRIMNRLGVGFLEKPYENALVHEIRKSGLSVSQQYAIVIPYDDITIGDYTADLLVERTILVELKVARALDNIHVAQCINYLKATKLPLCLLLNFGNPRLQVRRIANGV